MARGATIIKAGLSGGQMYSLYWRRKGEGAHAFSFPHRDDSYVQLLSQTFQKASFFGSIALPTVASHYAVLTLGQPAEPWIAQYEKGPSKDLVDLLRRVADFFYNVILAFAIR